MMIPQSRTVNGRGPAQQRLSSGEVVDHQVQHCQVLQGDSKDRAILPQCLALDFLRLLVEDCQRIEDSPHLWMRFSKGHAANLECLLQLPLSGSEIATLMIEPGQIAQ